MGVAQWIEHQHPDHPTRKESELFIDASMWKKLTRPVNIHRSLMVRIAGFHPADPGSIPGDEVFYPANVGFYTCAREVKGGGLISTAAKASLVRIQSCVHAYNSVGECRSYRTGGHWFESNYASNALAWELLEGKTSVGIQLLQSKGDRT